LEGRLRIGVVDVSEGCGLQAADLLAVVGAGALVVVGVDLLPAQLAKAVEQARVVGHDDGGPAGHVQLLADAAGSQTAGALAGPGGLALGTEAAHHLRATCITNLLRVDLPVAEVARRAGNSPEVIHRRYAGCIDDSEEENNKKIERTMGWDVDVR
jgi:hypothetical protein